MTTEHKINRPIYETDKDRENENAVLVQICSAWNCWAKRMPKNSVVDSLLFKNEQRCAYAEIKCINYATN